VTNAGMFGSGTGWGISPPGYTSSVLLGSIARKPGVVGEQIEVREYLCLTVSVDHDIVDGAVAARFSRRLKELIESGGGLSAEQQVLSPPDRRVFNVDDRRNGGEAADASAVPYGDRGKKQSVASRA
jgi:hypothetical protein